MSERRCSRTRCLICDPTQEALHLPCTDPPYQGFTPFCLLLKRSGVSECCRRSRAVYRRDACYGENGESGSGLALERSGAAASGEGQEPTGEALLTPLSRAARAPGCRHGRHADGAVHQSVLNGVCSSAGRIHQLKAEELGRVIRKDSAWSWWPDRGHGARSPSNHRRTRAAAQRGVRKSGGPVGPPLLFRRSVYPRRSPSGKDTRSPGPSAPSLSTCTCGSGCCRQPASHSPGSRSPPGPAR